MFKIEYKDGGNKEIESGALQAGWNDVEITIPTDTPANIHKASIFPDFLDDAAGQVLWVDDLVFPSAVIGGADAAALTVDFNSDVIAFEGGEAYADNKADANNEIQSVMKIVKPAGAKAWAGATIVTGKDGSDLTVDNSKAITMKVYAEAGQDFMLKVENKAGEFKEITSSTLQAGWNDVSIALPADTPDQIIKASIFPDFLDDAAGQALWIDDVVFPDALFIAQMTGDGWYQKPFLGFYSSIIRKKQPGGGCVSNHRLIFITKSVFDE